MKFNLLKIKTLLTEKNMTVKDFSQKIGKAQRTVENYLGGNSKIDVYTLEDISNLFGVPVSYFFDDSTAVPSGLQQGCATPTEMAEYQKQIIALQAENSRLKDRIIELQDKMYQLKTK